MNVYIDGKFSFGTSLETVFKKGIKEGKEISQDLVERLKEESSFEKCYNRALNFATLRPRSENELRQWFERKGVSQEHKDEIVKRLKELNLLNDKAFTSWWIEQRTSFRPKSKRALRIELKQKGVADEIVQDIIEESDIDEEGLAKNIVEKMMRKIEKYPFKKKQEKLLSALARLGFSWDISKRVVDDLLKKR